MHATKTLPQSANDVIDTAYEDAEDREKVAQRLDEDDTVSPLTSPIQRFRNQELPDARFYHGGVLPQEFVLNFVTITQEWGFAGALISQD